MEQVTYMVINSKEDFKKYGIFPPLVEDLVEDSIKTYNLTKHNC